MTPLQTYAVMVLCAGDVDTIWHKLAKPDDDPVLPKADDPDIAYVNDAYWDALAHLRCDDLIITKGLNTYYGLLLQCKAAFGPFLVGDLLCAVRGTMDPLEWVNDALAEWPVSVSTEPGMVASGFWKVYDTMSLNDMNGALLGDNAAVAIAAKVKRMAGKGAKRLYVTGHSLGASLATYLTADLEKNLAGSSVTLDPYFFASPRTGTPDYTLNYQATVATYSVINYAGDLVPNLPTTPPFQTLIGGGPTHDVHHIPLSDPNRPPFDVGNNHSPVGYAHMLDPSNPVASALFQKLWPAK